MWQKKTQYKSAAYLTTLLLASASVTATFRFAPSNFQPLMAQTAEPKQSAFPLPTSVESGTTVRLDGSSSMARINDSLKQAFENKFAGSKVEVANNGTSTAIGKLESGQIDLAGIGRALTKSELDKGLQQTLLRREKIAIIVSEDNPFNGSLTDDQFAKMFRGEITDWSQVGGTSGAIRFIDRPASNDTRKAFRNYPVFQTAKFETGQNAVTLEKDDTVALVKSLGNDGIGYVIANQVKDIPGIRTLKMHQTLPDDPRYPYSQPLVYAFAQNPSPGVKSFLGFAGAEPGTEAVEAAIVTEAKTIAQAVGNPSADGNTPASSTATANADSTDDNNLNSANGESVTSGDRTPGSAASNGENQQTANANSTTEGATSNNGSGSNWLWWLAPVGLGLGGGGLLWLLTRGARSQEEPNLTPASATGDLSGEGTSAGLNAGVSAVTTAKADSDRSSTADNVDGISPENTLGTAGDALPGGIAATAGAAAVGAGLWGRLTQTNKNEEVGSKDTEDLEQPLDVVLPKQEDNFAPTEVSDSNISLENDTDRDNPNLATQAGAAGLAGGAAVVGMGLWNRLTDRDDIADTTPEARENRESIEGNHTPVDENLSQPSPTTTPEYLTPLPDVWDETADNDTDTSVSDRITPNGSTIIGGAAAATGVASAGQSLWNNLAENSPANPDTENIETSNLDIGTTESQIPLTNHLDVAVDPLQTAVNEIPLPTPESSPQMGENLPDTAVDMGVSENQGATALAAGVATAGLATALNSDGNSQQPGEILETDAASGSETETLATESGETSDTSTLDTDATSAELNQATSQIQLTPRTPKWAYVAWNIADNERSSLLQQGASQLTLRLYDVTNIDLSYQTPQLVQQYECEESICNRFIAIPTSDRDYMAEIGYNTDDERWLLLARSPIVRVFHRSHQEFWFEADAELIIHGATQPGSTVKIGGHSIKVKQDGTFHLRIPFSEEILDYTMTAVAENGEQAKTIHMHFAQDDNHQV